MNPILYDHVLKSYLEEDTKFSDTFNMAEYDTMYFLNNAGFLAAAVFLMFMSIIGALFGSYCCFCKHKVFTKIKNYSIVTRKELVFNGLITLFYDGYLIFVLCFGI